jgi:hypothetical protein
LGSTAKPLMRPEVNAGPIERSLSPLNVGVDIGSRGVGEASGVGVGLALGDGDGVGDGAGDGVACGVEAATAPTDNNSVRTRDNTHEDMLINNSLLVVIEMELVFTGLAGFLQD